MKLFLDTNIWIRYFVGDDATKLRACQQLFAEIEAGKIRPYVSSVVLLEVYWVLTSAYDYPKLKAAEIVKLMLAMRGVVIVEQGDFRRAFTLHRRTGVKLADCLIATQLGKGIALCTYDREFSKLPSLTLTNPSEVSSRSL
jgi:predicted nucleic acid-binding protein